MNTMAPPSLTSMRPGLRMISPPRMSSSQIAVASGSGLRRWTWSQVTTGIFGVSDRLIWRGPPRRFEEMRGADRVVDLSVEVEAWPYRAARLAAGARYRRLSMEPFSNSRVRIAATEPAQFVVVSNRAV